jgi:hypothetical protein
LVDVAGRRVQGWTVRGVGAGRHVVSLTAAPGLPGGVYFVRLRQAGRQAVGRAVLLP